MWTKYDFLCTECDTLIEITTYWDSMDEPRCPCFHQAIVRINKQELEYGHGVVHITSPNLVKINSNPYT